ncbi:MAG TPA: hypothetical protein VHY08_12455 [Bacillota bacterium]|nr:hypothetical protein [Bacillota bacterium]
MPNKVIVRNRIYRKGELLSKLIMLTSDYEFDSVDGLRNHFGDTYIMKELFDENIDQDKFEKSLLYRKYQEILDTGKDNELFCLMYKIENDLVVSLSEHINLHHISTNLLVNGEYIVPWECVDSKLYIADTWWEKDEDIINDIRCLSFVEFMKKYKGY